MSRITTRIFLGLALILAIGSAIFSIHAIKNSSDTAWATLAAALAVITSMISAWGSQRIVELEEDKLRPAPYPHFDTESRYGLMLLRVTNNGGGVAHNINLIWDTPLENSKKKVIRFSPDRESPEIPVLFPGKSISMIVDGHIQFLGMNKKHEYSGKIKFYDSRGKQYKDKFLLDAEMFKGTPRNSEEEPKTHHELQKIPKEINNISSALKNLEKTIANLSPDNDEP